MEAQIQQHHNQSEQTIIDRAVIYTPNNRAKHSGSFDRKGTIKTKIQ